MSGGVRYSMAEQAVADFAVRRGLPIVETDRAKLKIGAAKPPGALTAIQAVGGPSDSDGAPDSASAFALMDSL